jgi:hypothetical protein
MIKMSDVIKDDDKLQVTVVIEGEEITLSGRLTNRVFKELRKVYEDKEMDGYDKLVAQCKIFFGDSIDYDGQLTLKQLNEIGLKLTQHIAPDENPIEAAEK